MATNKQLMETGVISDNGKGRTQTFNFIADRDAQLKTALSDVYQALSEKGYNPINQIVGYILSEDPTYITNHKNARSTISKIDRDELLNCLVRNFLNL